MGKSVDLSRKTGWARNCEIDPHFVFVKLAPILPTESSTIMSGAAGGEGESRQCCCETRLRLHRCVCDDKRFCSARLPPQTWVIHRSPHAQHRSERDCIAPMAKPTTSFWSSSRPPNLDKSTNDELGCLKLHPNFTPGSLGMPMSVDPSVHPHNAQSHPQRRCKQTLAKRSKRASPMYLRAKSMWRSSAGDLSPIKLSWTWPPEQHNRCPNYALHAELHGFPMLKVAAWHAQ